MLVAMLGLALGCSDGASSSGGGGGGATPTANTIVLYHYLQLGRLGPFPGMYEPIRYPENLLSAIGEALAVTVGRLIIGFPGDKPGAVPQLRNALLLAATNRPGNQPVW
jgi:hypothetical protein